MQRSHLFVLLVILAAAIVRAFYPAPVKSTAFDGPFAALVKEAEKADIHGDYQHAIDLYTTAIADPKATDDERRDFLRRRGSAREWAHQYAEAEADFNAALEIKPLNADVYFRRGYFYQRRKQYDKALADFAAGKRLNPTDGWFDFGEGEIDAARGNHRAAIAHYSEAIRLKPKMFRAYFERGSEYNYEQMFKEAWDDYDVALNDDVAKRLLSPRMLGLGYLGRGYAALQLGQYRPARDDFDHVLKVEPRFGNALAWRGGAHQGLGDRERAIADYKAALALDPKNAYARENLNALEK